MGIVEYIGRRLLMAIPTLFGVAFMVFLMLHLTPGDPVILIIGVDNYTAERAAEVRASLGLDDPFLVQFARYVGRAAVGDFGDSIRLRQPAWDVVAERLPATLELAVVSLLFAVAIALPVGVIAAVRRNSVVDVVSTGAALLGGAMPNFWLGLVLIMTFSVQLGWLPPSGRYAPLLASVQRAFVDGAWAELGATMRHLLLPAIAMGTSLAALLTRLVRATVLDVLQNDYITTARTKGLSERRVLFRHALRNAFIPILTVIGLQLGALLGGSIITETIFSWPGVGRMLVGSIFTRDFPVVQTAVLVVATLVVAVNLVTDVLYAYVDPRIRFG